MSTSTSGPTPTPPAASPSPGDRSTVGALGEAVAERLRFGGIDAEYLPPSPPRFSNCCSLDCDGNARCVLRVF